MKRLIAFDMDGTLAASKQPLEPAMAALIARLLAVVDVAVISGGDWPQFETQLVSRLPAGADLTRLSVLPTTGTKLYRFDGAWRAVYAELFDDDERARIVAALAAAGRAAGLADARLCGPQVEDRGSQITFSALGQQAPLDAKAAWDSDQAKRRAIQKTLRAALPGLSITIGGATSIDVTRAGVDKAYGLARLAEHSGVPTADMLFFGDAIYPGGNDDPVRAAGIDAIKVRDVAETQTAVAVVLAMLGG